jgi:hypothetical protein
MKVPSSAYLLRRCAVVRFVTAFFSTRGTWHGYVLRVGIIWFSGLLSILQYWLDYIDGAPPSAEALVPMLCWNTVLGALFGVCFFGVIRGAEERRRSIIAERVGPPPASANR